MLKSAARRVRRIEVVLPIRLVMEDMLKSAVVLQILGPEQADHRYTR